MTDCIRFEDVVVQSGGVTMLDRLSLEIRPGLPTAVLGPNGSGKTTLLRAAMGLAGLSRGGVTCPPETRRAIVFQRPVMLRRSAAENVRYALSVAGVKRERQDGRIAELFAMAGLQGLETRPARRLSGGEQQRLALARALARDPSVLFLDEPGASLDPYAARAIEDVIRAIGTAGVKVVIATHDLGCAKRLAGDVIFLHRGRLVESGPAEEFFKRPATEEARKFLAGDLLV